MADEPNPPVNIPPPDLNEDSARDSLASMEEEYWEEYDEISAAKKKTSLAIHKVFGWIIPIALSLAFALFVIVLAVYVAHLLLPSDCRWLTADEIQHIHSMLFSGVVGGAIAIAAKTYFLDRA